MLLDLNSLGKRLQVILMTKREEDREEARALTAKMNALIQKLRPRFGVKKLKHALGVLAFLFGLSSQANAQNFAPPLTNPFGLSALNYIAMPTFVDIDGDGDLDLFVMETDGNIKYFQNTGTANNPQFAAPVENPFGIVNDELNSFLAFGDVDGDGDKDFFAGDGYGSLRYFQNTGTAANPQFAAPVTNPFGITAGLYLASPTLADLDGDGDLDLLMGSYEYIDPPYYDFKGLRYFKNIGTTTAPNFQLQTDANDPFNAIVVANFAFPHFVDLDNDGDYDLLFGEYYGVLKYHQNIGTAASPVFSTMGQTNPFGLQAGYYLSFITSGDLDNDGDMDILIGEYGEYYADMKYYRNTSINLSLDEEHTFDFRLHPNPATDVVRVLTSIDVVAHAELLDINGCVVKSIAHLQDGIDISDLAAGVYLIKLTNQRGEIGMKRLVKN